ncbi:unnamed protein product [Paramecium octaurelia]|uniref:Transmembrane protein n=1 Tax=Paramecium octaurelia TaxID=43137 RepID=A0A8S1UGT0_PAROT|nr:unnamed protein product [Paramecium octaurelia]
MIFLLSLFIALYGQAVYPSYNVYLTQGETYSLYLKELFQQQILNFTIQDNPDNVQLLKALNIFSEQNNNQTFTSISATPPFYLLITQVNKLNVYQWNSSYVNLINQVDLPQEICLNALLFVENSILIDCYNLTNLNMYLYQENVWTIAYSKIVQQMPKNTDLKSFTSNQINSILYAQYYDNNQILTQFQFDHNLLFNISNWKFPFINFIVSNKLQSQNTIYLWDYFTLYLLNLTQEGLNLTKNYTFPYQIIEVQIFNPQIVFYECDTLLVMSIFTNYYSIICNQAIQELQQLSSHLNHNITQFQTFLSNQFLILQLFDLIQIYENVNLNFKLIGAITLNSSSTQVSFDYNSNELFLFDNTNILTYLVETPQIKFISNQNQQNYQLILIGSQNQISETYEVLNFTVQLNVSVLQNDDNKAYLIYEKNIDKNAYIFQNQNYDYVISQYSGSLFTANFSVENSSMGNFNDITFQNVGVINLPFQNLQFLNIHYAVGIKNQNIYLLNLGDDSFDQFYFEIIWNSTINPWINLKNNQIQGYAFDDILFGVQINSQQLYICQYLRSNINQTFILTFQPFQQFYLLFQQVVLLLESNIIQICSMTGNCSNLQINHSSNYSVTPVGIVLNQFSISSTLLINNNYSSIIVGQITQENTYITYSIINVEISVQDMKIVNNRLILNYNCQSSQFICFQVWNVQNLNFPFLEKNLRSIQNSNNAQYFADNLFYYVQTNNQIYVYNPALIEHSTLFYTFNYSGSYFTSASTDLALISFNSSFYLLSPLLVYTYQNIISNTIKNEISTLYNNYNVSVSSQIGTQQVIQTSSNQQIITLNDFLNIQLNNQTYMVSNIHETITLDNITFSGQILWFQINCSSSNSQAINFLNQTDLISLKDSVIAVFNQQILCYHNNQSNFFLQIYNVTSEGVLIQASKRQNYNQNCIHITALMNAQYIFLFCQQSDLQGYQHFDLFKIDIKNQYLSDINYLASFDILSSQNPILQEDILYIFQEYLITIFYVSTNMFQRIQTLCCMLSFQSFAFQHQNSSYYANIYVCKDNENIYYQLGKRISQKQIQFNLPKYIYIKDKFYFDSQVVGILIVSSQVNQISMMCFINQFSIIIKLIYMVNEMDFSQSTLKFKRLLYYSPQVIIQNSQELIGAAISSGLVFVSYEFGVVIYNISSLDLNVGNLDYPILPSSNLSQSLYHLQILTFNSSYGFIFSYVNFVISSFKIQIQLTKATDYCTLTASNLVNQKIANYTLYFYSQIDFGFEYALLAFMIVVFLAALTFLWYNTKNQKEQFGLEEFEGFEIDTFQ